VKRVPELRNLHHPVMHQVLLAILGIIEHISAGSLDPLLQKSAQALNNQGREELLIGPVSGVVTCPDYRVKAKCLKCVSHVLRTSPDQFELEEMGWLLRFFTTTGIGIPRQQDFLGNVLVLISLLICNQQRTGKSFRERFAKTAIREAFEILRAIAKRGSHGSADEQASRLKISLGVVELLKKSSRPLSGGLRKFLRRNDLMDSVIEVFEAEDKMEGNGCGAELLATWTGREVRHILLPIITGNKILLSGAGRFWALVRLADVLEGRLDYDRPPHIFRDVPATDEHKAWATLMHMEKVHGSHDKMEEEDWVLQQRRFLVSDSFQALIHFVWRYTEAVGAMPGLEEAYDCAETWFEEAEQEVRRWWKPERQHGESQRLGADVKQSRQQQTDLERCFDVRLRSICPRVSTLCGYNLNVYDEEEKSSSLAALAKVMAVTFQENHKKHKNQYAQFRAAYDELLQVPNQYYVPTFGRLMTTKEIIAQKAIKCIRQEHNDLHILYSDAALVQRNLKRALIAGGGPQFRQQTLLWANAEYDDFQAGRVPRAVSDGLVGFLRDHQAKVIDPGLLPKEDIDALHKFKLGGDNTRLRNLSRLMISYPNVKELLASLNEMKYNAAFSVMRIRNQFASPSNFAQRTMLVNVETETERGRFLSELQLVVREKNSQQDMYAQRAKLGQELKKVLIKSCKVKEVNADEVAGFLIQQMESRSLRSGDVVVLRCADQNLTIQGEDVSVFAREVTTKHLFTIERVAGPGPIADGDLVYLKSKATNKYIDVGANNVPKCRFFDAKSEQSNMLLIVERDQADFHPTRGFGGFAGATGMFAGAANHALTAYTGTKNLHTREHIRFRVDGTQRYLSALEATNWTVSAEPLRVKALPLESEHALTQFTVLRDGSVTDFLHLEGGQGISTRAQETADEMLRQALLEAHMFTSLPTMDLCPREGGVYFRPPPLFEVIAEILAAREKASREEPEGQSDSAKEKEKIERMPRMIAAILRCVYVLIQLPGSVGAKEYALTAMLNQADGTFLTKLFALVIFVQRRDGDCPDVLEASLSAKFLRLLSATLASVPPLSCPIRPLGDLDDAALQQKEEQDRASGVHCQQRVTLLHVFTRYMRERLVPSLLDRLDSARWGSSLSSADVVLLREFAICITTLAHNFFACELRKDIKSGVADTAAVLDAPSPARPSHMAGVQQLQQLAQSGLASVEGVAGEITAIAAEGVAGLEDQALATALGDHFARRRQVPALSDVTRTEIFLKMLENTLVRVLVHALLYGVHQEAVAFSEGRGNQEVSIRLNSSMVDHCICALGTVMYGSDSKSEDNNVDYDVCEAISQAMSNSTQIVPRARMAQLMHERATDHLRLAMQTMLERGWVPDAHPSERVGTVARAWYASVQGNEIGAMPLCAVCITSRLNFLVVQLPEEMGNVDTKKVLSDMRVLCWRDLRYLKKVIVAPRMRQFMGLWWMLKEYSANEVLIFENSTRRRVFQEALQIVPGDTRQTNPNGTSREDAGLRCQQGGIPAYPIAQEVCDSFEMTSKKDRGPDVNIISITCVRSQHSGATNTWGCGTVTARNGGGSASGSQANQVELLILSTDTVCIITMQSFLLQYAKYNDAEYLVSPDGTQCQYQDSDSEDEAVQNFSKEKHLHSESLSKMTAVRNSPWQFSSLQGVWFLAEAESKARLQFGKDVEEILFTSDGERQRFRRQLAAALAHTEHRDRDAGHAQWSVMPSDKTNLNEVQKHAKGLHSEGKQVSVLGDVVRRPQ